jgi:outer membrane immunogenic protein
MTKTLLLAGIILAASSFSVFADDIPIVKANRQMAPLRGSISASTAPLYSWDGYYIGGFASGLFSGDGFTSDDPSVTGSRSGSGIFGGMQAGINYELPANFLMGINAEIGGLSNQSNSFTDGTSNIGSKTEWLASLTGRVGYALGRTLIYVKGGGSFRGYNTTPSIEADRHVTGYTVGAGLEYMITHDWTAQIEYQYYDFNNTSLTFGSLPSTVSFRDNIQTIKAGINYHFDWKDSRLIGGW